MPELLENIAYIPSIAKWLISAILAGLWGSFLNMAIWRIPRKESIIFPRSHCPVCLHVLGIKDLIPLFSYLFLRGRCAYCKTKFGPRYFFVELVFISLISLYFYLFAWTKLFFIFSLATFLLILVIGMSTHKKIDSQILKKQKAFTFIEIMLSLIIFASIIIPFGNIFLSNYSRAIKNLQYFKGWNLVESKIEELKLVPFSRLKSDYELYIKTERRDDNIFLDERFGSKYQEMRDKEDYFYEHFSDIYTEENQLPERIQLKMKKIFEKYYGLPFELHPSSYKDMRRVVKVEPVEVKKDPKFYNKDEYGEAPISLLKITVIVTIDSKTLNRKLEASIFRAK